MNQNLILHRLLAAKDEAKEDTTIIAGREVTITQEPFMKAEIKAARTILQNLRSKRQTEEVCYTSTVINVE